MSVGLLWSENAGAIALDTHPFVKRLTESGFIETLAEEHVAFLNANLATKADIDALRQQTRASTEAVKPDLLKWLFSALIA